jgi:hypothetical protein
MPSSNVPLIMTIQPKAKEYIRPVVVFLFHLLQNIIPRKVAFSMKIYRVFRAQADSTLTLPSATSANAPRHLPRKMPSRGTTYWEAPWRSDKPAQWTRCITMYLYMWPQPPQVRQPAMLLLLIAVDYKAWWWVASGIMFVSISWKSLKGFENWNEGHTARQMSDTQAAWRLHFFLVDGKEAKKL